MGTGLDLLQSSVCLTGIGNYRIYYRGGSKISEKGVLMFKGMGVALLILSHFSSISHENERCWSH